MIENKKKIIMVIDGKEGVGMAEHSNFYKFFKTTRKKHLITMSIIKKVLK